MIVVSPDYPEDHGEEIKEPTAFWLDDNKQRRCYYRCRVPGCPNKNFHQSIWECEQCQYVMGMQGVGDCTFDCDAETEEYIKRFAWQPCALHVSREAMQDVGRGAG